MGFTEPNFPRVEPEAFLNAPFLERVKILALNWVENGYGVPRMVHVIYIVKLVFFYALGGIMLATATSDLPAFWHVSEWWNQPIVYQKVILWTVLIEAIGARWVMGSTGRQDQTDDGRRALLGAARHNPIASLAAGSLHLRLSADVVRRHALCHPDRQRDRAAGTARRAQ